ncbi:hypothetical protein EYR40_006564 [Pleurotus pulmonarius]|nr:hypothetical protein EYR36_011185 [Pleurotus pulmonarius]KAF4599470.1 hypothetical protein EYR40_006564 [Pleurotus pulmonarius]
MQSLALPAIFFGLGGRIVLDMLTRSAESSFQEFLLLGVWEGVGVHCAFTYSDYGIIAAVGVALHLFVDFSGTQDLVRSFCTFIGVAAGVLSSEVLSNLINDNSKEHSKKRSYIDSYGDSHRDRAKDASKRKERGTYDSPRHKAFRQSHSDITSVDSNSELIHIRPFMTPREKEIAALRARASLADSERRRFKEERKWAVSQGDSARASQMKWQVKKYKALMESFLRQADIMASESDGRSTKIDQSRTHSEHRTKPQSNGTATGLAANGNGLPPEKSHHRHRSSSKPQT